jgi:hypothetical protein
MTAILRPAAAVASAVQGGSPMLELSEKLRALVEKTDAARGDTLRALAKDLEDKIAGRYAQPQTRTFGQYQTPGLAPLPRFKKRRRAYERTRLAHERDPYRSCRSIRPWRRPDRPGRAGLVAEALFADMNRGLFLNKGESDAAVPE